MNYQGSCHCGAVRFSFTGPAIESGLRCNCSICRRKGALMTPFIVAKDDMTIRAEDGALSVYEFETGVARHYFCKHCGIYPFHTTRRFPGQYRVNIGCVDGVDAFALPFEVFDGAAL